MPNEYGANETKTISGDHDPTIMPRAGPVVEAMTAMTILDYAKRFCSDKLKCLKE